MGYVVYMVLCADDTYYTGVATDLARRLRQHNGELAGGARYTASRRPVVIAYQQTVADRSQAQKEEARIKSLTRAEKQRLARRPDRET